MKQILLLTDFSENSTNAIQFALELLKDYQCNFFVLHVQKTKGYISDDLVMGGGQNLYDSVLKTSKNKLTKLVNTIETKFGKANFKFKSLIDFDSLTEAINQVIASKAIDLIVMGNNGVTGAAERIFGSNTINVIRNVNCPTLVIPEGFTFTTVSELLLPLELEDTLNSTAFSELVSFTSKFFKRIHLLRLNPNEDSQTHLNTDKNYINSLTNTLQFTYHLIKGVPTEYAVQSYVQIHNIDMISLLVQKKTFFERFFTGSKTSKISNKLRVPLLVFHV
ncbi:universal stress protein [Winogradskyella endarachnes]|uniref:Universal stress protein n=1 Tax=Winogradskyella endarachnes TaxID=2681965 RepID=A0A6L6UBF6_9FLAO|nr:universal stress protein [Winogradskyella endarachnes]MUU79695.1 universal stress protein [Winogradskyella endarachnes]